MVELHHAPRTDTMANQISMIEKSAGTQYAIKTVPMRIMKCTNTHGVRRPYLSEKQHLNLSCAHPETESPVADQKYNPTDIYESIFRSAPNLRT